MNTTPAIALDLGTTAIKGARLDAQGKLQNIVSRAAPAISVNGTLYESDALAYAQTAEAVLTACTGTTGGKLGLCSQRSSFLLWNAQSGIPVTPLISWQDGRGAASCAELVEQQGQIRARSGLPLTPYYFAPKLRALLKQHDNYRSALLCGHYKVGTLDSFLIWRWSAGRHHVTDASMAARTQLMDIATQDWSERLCTLFDIPAAILPEIIPSAGLSIALEGGRVLCASVADQSAALIASMPSDSRSALVNLGTGGFVVRYADSAAIPEGYLRTLVYRDRRGLGHLAGEGTLNSITAALAPYDLRHCNVAGLAAHDIYSLAEPSGLGAPYFRKDWGLLFSADIRALRQEEVATLLLEAVIFRVARILEAFHRGSPLQAVYLSGGLTRLAVLRQGIALCAPCPVLCLEQPESSLLGAAMLAADIAPGTLREATLVHPDNRHGHRLRLKYQAWKIWLDGLLA